MDEKKKKQIKKYLPLIAVIVAVLIIAGASFAYYSANINKLNETMTDVSTNVLGLEYNGVTDIDVSGIIPGDVVTKTFTVRNKTNHAISYNIYMEEIENEFNTDVVYQIFETDSNYENPVEVVPETPLPVTNEGKTYLKININIDAKPTIQYYKMVITYKYYPNKIQKVNNGKSFTGTVGIDTEPVRDYICKRATELHDIPTESLDYYGDYYGTEFGKIGTPGTLTVGDAYDCDVNGDGEYNSETERFYYISKSDEDDSNVVLLYSGVMGPATYQEVNDANNDDIGYGTLENTQSNDVWTPVLLSNNKYGPYGTLGVLPGTDTWSNVPLSNSIKTIYYWDGYSTLEVLNDSFNYQNKAARLMTYNELARVYNAVNKSGYYSYLNSGGDSGYDSGNDSGYDSGYDDSGNDSGDDSGSDSNNSDYIPGTTIVNTDMYYGSSFYNIPFLLENTSRYNSNAASDGFWLSFYSYYDDEYDDSSVYYISTYYGELSNNNPLTEYYIKPVIEVPRALLEI